ncbi:MAG: type III pantothenate kinase [Candidatus Omnitrophica bacterium]|nr:type III pantothenate kinase [Candidatus Omnitrophota bacterium]
MKCLLIDIGNTNVSLGSTIKGELFRAERVPSKNILKSLKGFIKKEKPGAAVICSVVPPLSKKIRKLLKQKRIKLYECGREIQIPVKNLYKIPKEVGQDRLINVYAVNHLYKNVRLVIDLGTALTFDFISKDGEYLGGLIFPGLRVSLAGLLKDCALLPKKVILKRRHTLYGRSTSECITSGMVLGYSFLIRGLAEHLRKKKRSFKILITGGDCRLIRNDIARFDYVQPNLSLKGLGILWKNLAK